MMRVDLIALTQDDLELLTNRGTVKRAMRELAEKEVTFELFEEDSGDVKVDWSDGIVSRLPMGRTLHDAQCTCTVGGICRHLVRAVLAYQETKVAPQPSASAQEPAAKEEAPAAAEDRGESAAVTAPVETTDAVAPPPPQSMMSNQPWDPGAISDEELAKFFKPAVLAKAKKLFDAGLVVELVRSNKPFARFHSLSYTLKFLVPDHLRYTHCDCAENPPPCSHVPMAIWAFRRLDSNRPSGIISTETARPKPPIELLDKLEDILVALCVLGVNGSTQALTARLKRAAAECLESALIWPSEIINELLLEIERYHTADARYSGMRVAELVGELASRCDAIRNDTNAMPQMFIRGAQSDRGYDMSTGRMIGLGCGGSVHRKSVDLTAYFQDQTTGNVLTLTRDFDTAGESSASPFWKLAAKPIVKGISLRQLGSGQILTKGGKLSPSREYNPSRMPISVNHQMYKWELLKAPVYAENFAELRAVLAARPPLFLGPRYKASSFFVCAVSLALNAGYSDYDQSVECQLVDSQGEYARLSSPFLSRSADGNEILLKALQEKGAKLKFVAGQVTSGHQGLHFHPVACVFEESGSRTVIQPWIDKIAAGSSKETTAGASAEADGPTINDPIQAYPARLLEHIGETLTNGLDRADTDLARQWTAQSEDADSMGFSFLLACLNPVTQALDSKKSRLDWDSEEVARHLLTLSVATLIAREEVMR